MSLFLDIQTLHRLFTRLELSPVEHLQATIERMEKVNLDIRAFVQFSYDEALSAAQEAEDNYKKGIIKSPLQGITVGIKDVIQTKDAPVTMETELYYEHPIYPQEDAFAVERLRQAGAVIVGKTNTHEMGMGPTGDVGYSGHARNSYDSNKVTGGSSSGSAAAISAGLCDVTLGSDTGGSIRLPGALSGVVGMKPSFGRVSNRGFFPLSYSCDAIGPMTKNIRDNAEVLQAISAYDPEDMYSKAFPEEDLTSKIGQSIEGMRIGIPYHWLEEKLDQEIRANFYEVIDVLKSLGARLVEVDLPSRSELESLRAHHQRVLISEGYHAHQAELAHPGKFDEGIHQRLLGGNQNALDYIASYQKKQKLIDLYRKIYEQCEVLVTPAVMLPACDLYQTEVTVEGQLYTTMKAYTEFTWLDSFSGFPSLNLPSGFNREGLPLGVLFNANRGEEARIYQAASALEAALDLELLPQGDD